MEAIAVMTGILARDWAAESADELTDTSGVFETFLVGISIIH